MARCRVLIRAHNSRKCNFIGTFDVCVHVASDWSWTLTQGWAKKVEIQFSARESVMKARKSCVEKSVGWLECEDWNYQPSSSLQTCRHWPFLRSAESRPPEDWESQTMNKTSKQEQEQQQTISSMSTSPELSLSISFIVFATNVLLT